MFWSRRAIGLDLREMDEPLPRSAQDFIAKYVVSLEQLEILLLLSESPDRFFTSDEIFRIIQSNQTSIAQRLTTLHEQGLLHREGNPPTYCFRPRSEDLGQSVALMRDLYRERRVRVIEEIFKPRTSAAQSFADAFKIRKDPPP